MNMTSSACLLLLSAVCATCTASRASHGEINSFRPVHLYSPQPVYLPIMPYYEIDIPEQQGKFFGVVATTTRYETIIVKETVRPVCLLVDGNVPSCDHIHNYNNRPNKPMTGRRPTVIDYGSYFVEPTRPDVEIEITEIPYRGVFLLTGATVEQQNDGDGHELQTVVHQQTPPLQQVVRPVTEDLRERSAAGGGGGSRQFLQNVLGAATSAITNGVGGAVANAGGLAAGGINNAVGGIVSAAPNILGGGGGGGGGSRPEVTIYVTRVDKVVDNHVTATLVPKNCMPAGGRVDGLMPCQFDHYAAMQSYHSMQQQLQQLQQQQQQQQQPPPPSKTLVSVDIVSKVNGLVQDFVDAQTTQTHRYRYHTAFKDDGRIF